MKNEDKKKIDNPYEKVFDDAKKQLSDAGVDCIDRLPEVSKSKGFSAPFPYGRPMNQSNGWH